MKIDGLDYSEEEIKAALTYCYTALMVFYQLSQNLGGEFSEEDQKEFEQAENVLGLLIEKIGKVAE